MRASIVRHSLLLLLLVTAACASSSTPPSSTGGQRDIIFDDRLGTIRNTANAAGLAVAVAATPDKTWDAMIAAYALIGVEVKYLNRPAGELGNRDAVLSRRIATGEVSKYLDCGSDPFAGPQANAYPVRTSLVTRMWAAGDSTKIETMFSGTMAKPGAGATVHCSSTGSLERLIGVTVNKIAAKPSI